MSVFKDFWNFIQNKLIGGGTVEISSKDLENLVDSDKLHELALYEFALNAGINIIANALSACEIRTFSRNKEVKGKEYYLWNYSPHVNMNANEFMHKIVWNLIYRNECLVIETPKGELLVADSYDHDTFALYPDVFRNVTVNATAENGVMHPFTFREEFRMDEVLFYRLSSKNITALLSYLMDGYNSLMQNAIDTFYRASGERGILTIDGNAAATQNYGTKPDGTPRTFQEVFTEMMNKQFKEYFKSSNAVMPVWKGFDYQVKGGAAQKRSTSEVKDITDLTTEIYTKVANALQIPPQLILGTSADVKDLTRNLMTFGVKPIAEMIETENNRKRNGRAVLRGTYQMIDTSKIQYTDIFDAANAAYNMLGAGATVDEIRELTGRPPLMTEWSQKVLISRNFMGLSDVGESNTSENGSPADGSAAESGKGGEDGTDQK